MMVPPQMTSTEIELLLLLTLSGMTFGHESDPAVVSVSVQEGSDVVLPCSLSSKKNITQMLFDWKKDDQKEVFMYDAGVHYNNGRSGQDEQFKGRVSHFPEELKHGSASIIIRDTKVADSGNYTCIFPHLQPQSQIFHIRLVVGAAPEPHVTNLDQTKDWALLQCVVRGAFPEPEVVWKDSANNIVPSEEPQVSERGGRFYITLQTTVTKTDRYHCVATQEEMGHQIHSEIFVHLSEFPVGWVVAAVVFGALFVGVVVLLSVLKAKGYTCKRGSLEATNHSSNDSQHLNHDPKQPLNE